MTMSNFPVWVPILAFFAVGCFDPPQLPQAAPAPQPTAVEETAAIKPFDPAAGKKVVDSTRPITDPITGPLAALQNAREKIPQLAIQHAIDLFHASEGRYPTSFDEFMARIIQENHINLPRLPEGLAWEYDVEMHRLLVVEAVSKP